MNRSLEVFIEIKLKKKKKSLPKCSIPEVFINSELGRGITGMPPVKYSLRTSAWESDDL